MPLIQTLLLIVLMLTAACGTGIKPEQIARVEENFDKIKPGMTKKQVEALVGSPLAEQVVIFDSKTDLCERPQCKLEVWALVADKDEYGAWPKVIFDHETGRVVKLMHEEFGRFFD
jgi:hypothetical protein